MANFGFIVECISSCVKHAIEGEENRINPNVLHDIRILYEVEYDKLKDNQIRWMKEYNEEESQFTDNFQLAYAKILFLLSGDPQFLKQANWIIPDENQHIFELLYITIKNDPKLDEGSALHLLRKKVPIKGISIKTRSLLLTPKDKKLMSTLSAKFGGKSHLQNPNNPNSSNTKGTPTKTPEKITASTPKSHSDSNVIYSGNNSFSTPECKVSYIPFLEIEPPPYCLSRILKKDILLSLFNTECPEALVKTLTTMDIKKAWELFDKDFVVPWLSNKVSLHLGEETILDSHRKLITDSVKHTMEVLPKMRLETIPTEIDTKLSLITDMLQEIQQQQVSMGVQPKLTIDRPTFVPPTPQVLEPKAAMPLGTGIAWGPEDI